MAQNPLNDLVAQGTTGLDLVAWLNGFKSNFITTNAGTSRPSYVLDGSLWANTTGSVYTLNYYDGTDDIRVSDIDSTTNKVRFAVDNDRDTYIVSGTTDDQIEVFAGGSKRLIVSTVGLGIGGNAPRVSLDCTGTDAIKLPAGTSTQRPSTAVTGMMRYNTTTTNFEGYNGTSWGALGGSGSGTGITTIAAATDTNIVSPANGNLLIYSSNRWLNRAMSGDGTISDTGVFSLATNSVAANNLLSNSVTEAKINNRAVSASKIKLQTIQPTHFQSLTTNGSSGQFITVDGNGGFNFTTPSFVVADGAVTVNKLASSSVSPVKIRTSNTGTAGQVFSYNTASQGQWVNNTPMKTKARISLSSGSGSFTFTDNPQMIWINLENVSSQTIGSANEKILIRINNQSSNYISSSSTGGVVNRVSDGFLIYLRSGNARFTGIIQLNRIGANIISSHSGMTYNDSERGVSGGGSLNLSVNSPITNITIRGHNNNANLDVGNASINYF